MAGKLKRHQDWPERLASFVASTRERPFAWGSWDCCLFVAAAVEAMTGTDLGAPFRGTYSDERGACAILDRYGSTEALWRDLLGDPSDNWRLAMRGDVVLVRSAPEGFCTAAAYDLVALSLGREVAFLTPGRMRFAPLSSAALTWRV